MVEGELQVSVNGVKLRTYVDDTFLGAKALMHDSMRTVTVHSGQRAVALLSLHKAHFDAFSRLAPKQMQSVMATEVCARMLQTYLVGTGLIKKAKADFWSDSEEAPAAELKSAGYLLAVAFKFDSKIPPDKIPAVKSYKKMMKDLDKLESAMSSGKASEATKAYATSKASLEAYLEAVELPGATDPRFDDPAACFFKCEELKGRGIQGN